jgi:hypothetical protein
MSRVLLLVEGQTERAIAEAVLAPYLAERGVWLYPRIVGKPGHKGGNSFSTVLRELKSLLLQEPSSTVTMFFDYYGLPDDWPWLSHSKGKRCDVSIAVGESAECLELSIGAAIADSIGASFNPARFIPYVQLYEVESLLFAGPAEMAAVFQRPELESRFSEIVETCGGCEHIDDGPETAPSKRIMRLFPRYRKGSGVNAHAYRIAQRIGVDRIRRACPHFNEWMEKLERLA